MDMRGYLNEVRALYASGQTTEHSFRPALSRLFASIDPALTVINEPRRIDVGAPDFVFNRNGISIGWCEAKDIDKNIRKFASTDYSKAQKERYCKGLPNLLYTNGLDFQFLKDGAETAFLSIADFIPTLPAREENFDALERLLREFSQAHPISIRKAEPLAQMMAGKAAIIKDIMARALIKDRENNSKTDINGQYEAFKANLIHDITVADFADIYAETIAYGLFAARLHDTSLDTFSRTEALELLPRSNPFLRSLFGYIAGVDLDDRIRWVIDELVDVFRAANLSEILEDFGRFTGRRDPFLHFYETFLARYNPAKRKARGVWYTPEPVVNFIVRAVDKVLAEDFGLTDGIADTSKIPIQWDTGQIDKRGRAVTIRKDVHRVQILDPATGTGTFLAEAIKVVARRVNQIAPGHWSEYAERDLIPRLHGFELLMASYAMCHMKLDMVLTELGYRPTGTPPRLSVYLTNSLEEGEKVEQNLFAQWLANEAKLASDVKRQTPVMCVIGNPPYSGISQNNGDWISALIEDYKYVDGHHFGEKKHWLQDDYVKFIRLAESLIEKNGEGVLGFITNHGYLANPTFRGMRNHLLKTFSKIMILDLHGNANKGEINPNGGVDQNVFDIRQGVAIIIAVKKKGAPEGMAELFRSDAWGTRAEKQDLLWSSDLSSINTPIDTFAPYYMFYQVSREKLEAYDNGISLANIFIERTVGAVTGRDAINASFTKAECEEKLEKLRTLSDSEARKYFHLGDEDARDWTLKTAREDAKSATPEAFTTIQYRPFDQRHTCYTGKSRGLYASPQYATLKHMLKRDNIALAYNKSVETDRPYTDAFVFGDIIQHHSLSLKEVNYLAPLYVYPDEGGLDQSIRANLDPKLYAKFKKAAGLTGRDQPITTVSSALAAAGDLRPNELKVFDYIYGVLHAPAYRETYREFLKIAFPRIPLPKNPDVFRHVSELGEALRRLHLMEDGAVGAASFRFEGDGDSVVDKVRFEANAVWINSDQRFADVPVSAWEFTVGSYQPAEKWLKDRKGRTLTWDDIRHYQRMIRILSETEQLIKRIDLPLG
jgi:hypothetical protein